MKGLLLLAVFALQALAQAEDIDSSDYILVRIEEYKLDDKEYRVDNVNTIAAWVVPKTDSIKHPQICTELLLPYLDQEEVKDFNINRLRNILKNSDEALELFSNDKVVTEALNEARRKLKHRIKNIDDFSYHVKCEPIQPINTLSRFFIMGE
ncbi:hypothetical protein M2G69_20695 [Vibrio vulnificus]|nr:hypothetical protein [Vibrio vulnificus]HAS8547614.1 hypothetical protein [Vibrio vulnificus]